MDVKQLLKKFVECQIEWLTMHDDVEFEPEDEQVIIKFLKDTEKCFMLENKDLPPVKPQPNRCNQCKYYEGVHNVQGHAPCSFLKCGGVLWDWYCSNYEPYKEGDAECLN